MANIEKIKKMEEILKNHRKAIDEFNEALDKFKLSQDDYLKLSDYFSSEVYMKDLEDSNNKKIDKSISQGIFSEDLVYNLIGDNYHTAIKMLDIGLNIIKNH